MYGVSVTSRSTGAPSGGFGGPVRWRAAALVRTGMVRMAIFELSAAEAGRALGTFAITAASRFRHARAELQLRWRTAPPSVLR